MKNLTEAELKIFKELVDDAGDWCGAPLWNPCDNYGKAENGVLTSLKKKKLVFTTSDETCDFAGRKKTKIQYVGFTKEGLACARELGLDVSGILQASQFENEEV